MTRDFACRDAAFDAAEGLLGRADVGRFVATIVGIARATWVELGDEWSFIPATRGRPIGHQRSLVGLIETPRRHLWSEVTVGLLKTTDRTGARRLAGSKQPRGAVLH